MSVDGILVPVLSSIIQEIKHPAPIQLLITKTTTSKIK
jgi:hypothetical protein